MTNKLISRYNVATNKFEIGYWLNRTTFIVVSTAVAA